MPEITKSSKPVVQQSQPLGVPEVPRVVISHSGAGQGLYTAHGWAALTLMPELLWCTVLCVGSVGLGEPIFLLLKRPWPGGSNVMI